MKKQHLILLLLWFCSSLPAFSQTAQEVITLSNPESGNKDYVAGETLYLKPGFSYTASGQNQLRGKIDPTLLFPPTANTYANENGTIVTSPSQGAVVGNLAGSFDVSPGGAAMYSVPIECLPGINGMQPNLSLVYNSQGGNGIMGMCWNLSGLSMISRTGKNYHFDGDKSTLIWDSTSPFALDGQRLIEIQRWGNSIKTDSIEYRTESGLDKIIAYEIKKWGPRYFKVFTKDGRILQYGNPTDMISYFPLETWEYTTLDYYNMFINLGWMLYKVTDANNNFIEYSYASYKECSPYEICVHHGHRISSIQYGNHTNSSKKITGKIEFNYIEHISPVKTYIDGSYTSNKYILDAINIQDSSGITHYTYDLSYDINENNYFLTDVKKSSSSGESLHPLKFEWSSSDYNFGVFREVTLQFCDVWEDGYSLSFENRQYGDINGDGIQDICILVSLLKNSKIEKRSWVMLLNNGDGTTSCVLTESCDKDCMQTIVMSDHDNDGKDELYIGYMTNERAPLYDYVIRCYKYQSNGIFEESTNSKRRIRTTQYAYAIGKESSYFLAADFFGKGSNQFLVFSQAEGYIGCSESLSSSDFPVNSYQDGYILKLTDINGNGKPELFFTRAYNYGQSNETHKSFFYEYDKASNSFIEIHTRTDIKIYDKVYIGDFNGDGNSDLFIQKKNDSKWRILYSTGISFIEKTNINSYFGSNNKVYGIKILDINQDGKSDIIAQIANNIGTNKEIYILINKGNDIFVNNRISQDFADLWILDELHIGNLYSNLSTDIEFSFLVLGDPFHFNYIFNYSLCENVQFNKITKIKDSFANELEINHKKQKNPFASMPDISGSILKKITPSLPVNFEVVDKITGLYLDKEFSFQYPKIHKQGKGFLGFMNIETKDNLNSIVSTTENKLNTTFYTLYPWRTTTKVAGKEVSKQTSSYSFIDHGKKRFTLRLDSIYSQDVLASTLTKKYYPEYDSAMNPLTIRTEFNDSIKQVETYTYVNRGSWCANKPETAQVRYIATGEDDIARNVNYTYDTKGNILTKTTDPGIAGIEVKTTYSNYDTFGNPRTIETKANNETRTSTFTYSADGRYLKTKTNHLGETTTYTYNEAKGLLTKKNTRLGDTNYTYDGFGRPKMTYYPDVTKSAQALQWAGTGAPTVNGVKAKYYTYGQSSGQAPVTTWYDALGREIRQESYGLNKKKVWVDTYYNAKGQVWKVSEPYFHNAAPTWAATYTYDTLGRDSTVLTPMGLTEYTYDGLTTTVKSLGITKESTVNDAGWTIKEKTNGKLITFAHYADGKVKNATPEGGQAVSMEYDLVGNRTKLVDPDAGTITSQYDGWGQLVEEKQIVHVLRSTVVPPGGTVPLANGGTTGGISIGDGGSIAHPIGMVTTYTYNPQGLLTSKRIGSETTNYEYNDSMLLTREWITGKHSRGYDYDDYDRIIAVKDSIAGNRVYKHQTEYDRLGRVYRETYPSGYRISHEYDTYGYLTKVYDSRQSLALWHALESNARGQLTQTRKGDKFVTTGYDEKGLLTSIEAPGITQLSYAYNADGTMSLRSDATINLTKGGKEEFTYDGMKRLSTMRVSPVSGPRTPTHSIAYNPETGNITSKSIMGITNMEYGIANGAKPHALTAFTPANDSAFPAHEIYYTDFKKVKQIKEGDKQLDISYGVDQQRIKSVMTKPGYSMTRYYLGDYEEEVTGTSTRKIHYVSGGDGLAALYVQNNGQDSLYFAFSDFQGNLIALAKADGSVAEKYAYDPWGNRRNPYDWQQVDTCTAFIIHRGYTLHEHLDDFNLINMNGRMYDPRLGMFLSPDPYIQAPGDWLNYNRYSYCLNNPLMYTDPSGEVWWLVPAITTAVFAIGNTIAHTIKGDVSNFNDALRYFGQGALTGFALGCAWQFAPLIPWAGNAIQTAMTWYAYGQAGTGLLGMIGGSISNGWNGLERAGQLLLGNFYLDENRSFFEGVWQGFSRHTWEIPQTLIGHSYTQLRNMFGQVDRVDYLGGATFATNENSKNHNGITFGNYINMNIYGEINMDFDTFATTVDPMYMHEYGHTIDSRAFGLSYLFGIGIPSLFSAAKKDGGHKKYWTETRANRRAAKYFGKYYGVNWMDYDIINRYPLR